MRRIQLRKPSPAMLVAMLALTVAVAGGGQAIADQTARIAKQIKGSSIKKGSITAKQIKSGTITGKQVKNDTLTGKQVKESSLTQVPSAATASTADDAKAVGGTKVKTFNFSGAAGSSEVLLNYAGFELTAGCDDTNYPILKMKNVSGGPAFADYFAHFGGSDVDSAFNNMFLTGDSWDLVDENQGGVESTLTTPGGTTISGSAIYRAGPSFNGATPNCVIAGKILYK